MALELCWGNGCATPLSWRPKLFGSTAIKIQNATSYACLNRYGGANTPLSEHALANALDVSEFVLANRVRITILDSWPKPAVAFPAPADSSSSRTAEGSVAPTPEPADKTASATATKDERHYCREGRIRRSTVTAPRSGRSQPQTRKLSS